MRRVIFGLILFILLLLPESAVPEDGKDEYMVIVLDKFQQESVSGKNALMPGERGKALLGSSGGKIGIYSLGRPLQIFKSYEPGRADIQRDISRTVAGITGGYAPEAYFGVRNSFSASEYIDRMLLSLHYPLSDRLSAGLSVYGGIYTLLDNGGESAVSTGGIMAEIQGRYRFNPELSIFGGLSLGGTHSVLSPGMRLRLDYANRSGVNISLAGSLWVPWDDNTLAVYNDGRSSGLQLNVSLPLSSRFRLDLNGGVDWRFTAFSPFAVDTFEGAEIAGGGRITWDLLKQDYRQLPVSFQTGENLQEGGVSSHFGLFAALQASEYLGRDESVTLIPVTQRRLDQRIGLSGEYVFTPHLSAGAEVYVGYDPARKIDFGKLYGFNTRMIFVPTAHLRIYGEFAMDSEAATGITEGRTWYYGVGLNYKF